METGLTQNRVISELTRSPHGALNQYTPIATAAAAQDPAFYGHLIAWNHKRGAIRDAKVALPVLALTAQATMKDSELRDNALAHIVSLNPREMLRAVRFAKESATLEKRRLFRTVEQYLRKLEGSPGRFQRVALQHRASLHELYGLLHLKPDGIAQQILFDGKKIGVFADVANLKNLAPDEIAGTIMRQRIPFLVARGALGAKAKEPAVVQALIGAMSPTELVTNSKALERLGVKSDPALRAAYEAGLQKVAQSAAAALKTTRAANTIGGTVGEKLKGAQEKQLDAMGMEGNWLVLADKSSSMTHAIEAARQVAAVLSRACKGSVHLIFFNDSAQHIDVTGKSYDEIVTITKRVEAQGSTSIGVGAQYATQHNMDVDGIALISDGAENTPPMFASAYGKLCKSLDKELPVYLYWMSCMSPNSYNNNPEALATACKASGIALDVFDLRGGVDYYSLPNVVATMRSNRHSLADEILATPLLRIEDVFKEAA